MSFYMVLEARLWGGAVVSTTANLTCNNVALTAAHVSLRRPRCSSPAAPRIWAKMTIQRAPENSSERKECRQVKSPRTKLGGRKWHKVLRARQIPFPPILGYVKATIHPWTCCSAGEPPKSSVQTLGHKGHLRNNWIVARFAAQVWIVGYVC